MQWLQASLPIRDGGLGVRRVSALALPAFLASAASTRSLQTEILTSVPSSPDEVFETYLATWSSKFSSDSPPEPSSHKQSSWDRPGVLSDRARIEATLSDAV